MEPTKQAFGYVVRKDGTIPFDDDPNRHPGMKGAILQDLAERGHTATHHPEGHISIQGWGGKLNTHPSEGKTKPFGA
jgi:hypothetical protein